MPKQLFVDPKAVRRPGQVTFHDLPIDAYSRPLPLERQRFGDKQLVEVLRHMLISREYEKMLNPFKAQGNFARIKFNYNGPVYLSIAQEAATVGGLMMEQKTNRLGLIDWDGAERARLAL